MRKSYLPFVFLFLIFSGCATVPPGPESIIPPTIQAPPLVPGEVYHRVERGQTLWRISKTYNVDLDDLARVNHILDTTKLEVGQMILIPSAAKPETTVNISSTDDFIWPVKGRVISTFGQVYNNMANKGLNIQPYSNRDVIASRSGRVVFYSPNFRNYGKTIIIDHGDGFSTVYARNSEVFIKAGDSVPRGTIIAKVGSSGRDRNEYLHFEIRKGHVSQNPYFYLP